MEREYQFATPTKGSLIVGLQFFEHRLFQIQIDSKSSRSLDEKSEMIDNDMIVLDQASVNSILRSNYILTKIRSYSSLLTNNHHLLSHLQSILREFDQSDDMDKDMLIDSIYDSISLVGQNDFLSMDLDESSRTPFELSSFVVDHVFRLPSYQSLSLMNSTMRFMGHMDIESLSQGFVERGQNIVQANSKAYSTLKDCPHDGPYSSQLSILTSQIPKSETNESYVGFHIAVNQRNAESSRDLCGKLLILQFPTLESMFCFFREYQRGYEMNSPINMSR